MKLLYVVSHAYPYSSNGYAVRTHLLAKALVEAGVEVLVVTRPGRPWDIPSFQGTVANLENTIEGVCYLCMRLPSRKGYKAGKGWFEAAQESFVELCHVYKPDAIMAASNWETALPVQKAAIEVELPFYYEIRGFWELSKASRVADYATTKEYRVSVKKEAEIAQRSNRVFTLTRQMINVLSERAVKTDHVSLLPNGVDDYSLMNPPKASKHVLSHKDMKNAVSIGYIGSFGGYEGLEDLIYAVAALCKQGLQIDLKLVGSSAELNQTTGECPVAESYQSLVNQLGVADSVDIPGRVSRQKVVDYYAEIDIIVIPRLPREVCEVVSPLKPLEAAAFRKTILVSDVAPLADMAEEGGFLTFAKGNRSDLIRQLKTLCENPSLRQSTAESAYKWVGQSRRFSTIIEPLLKALQDDGHK